MRGVVLAAVLANTLGCAGVHDATNEPVVSAEFHENELALTVISTGCTRKEHFRFNVEESQGSHAAITVVRLQPDLCRKMPEPVTFRYAFTDIDLKENRSYRVANPTVSAKRPIRR